MKKWLFLGIFAILFLFWGMYDIYHSIYSYKGKWVEHAKKSVLEETSIHKIDHIEFFHGEQAYRIAFGEDPDGNRMIAWVSEKDVVTESVENGIERKEIINQVRSGREPLKIFHAVPAIIDARKMWEVLFKDEKGRLNYYYYDFYSGQYLKSYRLNETAS